MEKNVEEFMNKNIVVITNLKPANIRGIKSNGMLLAAEDDSGVVSLLNPRDAEPGSEIIVEGVLKESGNVLEFEDFKKVKMTINQSQEAIYNNKILKSQKGNVISDKKVKKGAKIL